MSNYEIHTYTDRYEIYELKEHNTDSWLRIAPERGGIVIGFGSQGEELLYLDKETFYDPNANIRGGIPVLFPISGQLTNGRYEWNGREYDMKNHGIARIRPWRVIGSDLSDGAALTLSLSGDADTRESYPFDFELRFTYRLKEGRLTIEQEYRNRSDAEMPMYPGFHPYFNATRKAIAYVTDAISYFDYNDGVVKNFEGGLLDLESKVESVVFQATSKKKIGFTPVEGRNIEIVYGDEFRYIVLWTVSGKPFVCVEPWMARTDELNRKQELVHVPPHGTLKTFLSIYVK